MEFSIANSLKMLNAKRNCTRAMERVAKTSARLLDEEK